MNTVTNTRANSEPPVTLESIREMTEKLEAMRREWSEETGLPADMAGCRVVENPYLPEGAFALKSDVATAIVMQTEDGYKILHWKNDDFLRVRLPELTF